MTSHAVVAMQAVRRDNIGHASLTTPRPPQWTIASTRTLLPGPMVHKSDVCFDPCLVGLRMVRRGNTWCDLNGKYVIAITTSVIPSVLHHVQVSGLEAKGGPKGGPQNTIIMPVTRKVCVCEFLCSLVFGGKENHSVRKRKGRLDNTINTQMCITLPDRVLWHSQVARAPGIMVCPC